MNVFNRIVMVLLILGLLGLAALLLINPLSVLRWGDALPCGDSVLPTPTGIYYMVGVGVVALVFDPPHLEIRRTRKVGSDQDRG